MKRWAVVIVVMAGLAPFARAGEEEDLRRLAAELAELERKLADVTKEIRARSERVREGRKKAHAYQAKISELLREAEAAEDRGETGRARELRRAAREMNRELDALHARMGPKGLAGPEQILEGLHAGLRAARQAGDDEAAEHMERAIRRVERRIAKRGEPKRGREQDREVAAARGQVKTMRVAMHALLDAGRRDLAHRLEQKVHAIELAIEGRRDAEAREIQRKAPHAGAMTEILMYAADLLRKRNQPEWSERVAELAKLFRAKWKKERGDKESKERVQRTFDFFREGLRDEDARRMMARIERLEARVERITELLEELVERKR